MNTEYVLNRVCPALESGEYAQTRLSLRDRTGFCCLGVMTDLALQDGVIEGRWSAPDPKRGFRNFEPDGDSEQANGSYLPDPMVAFLDFADGQGPGVSIDGALYWSLAEANDQRRTFAEIAAALRTLAEAERATTIR